MNGSVHTQRRIGLVGVVLAAAVLAGCASRVSVPVRDGNGVAPAPATTAVPGGERVGVHIVKPGETLLAIARQYGQNVRDLVAWNNLTNPNQIHVGQELRVLSPDAATSGAVATAIPITSEPAVTMPVVPPAATGGAAIKLEPKGGKQAYSDDVWARVRRSGEAAPAGEVKPEVTPPAQESADAEWLWPAKGRVLNGFNEATNKGVDIAGNPGDPVIASAAGRVVYAGSGLRGYGKLVIIKHNQEYNSVYAHNQKLLVKEDDQVAKGQKIAELGSTDADRPKLHFEIRKQGRPVDPMKFLSAR